MVKKIKLICFLLIILFSETFANRVIGYYPYWVQTTFLPQNIDFETFTHINHAFAWPDINGEIVAPSSSFFNTETSTYIHGQDSKFILSLGGWGQTQGFISSTSSHELRTIFIDNIIEKLNNFDYDGVDIDWEHPQSFEQRDNLTQFIAELDSTLNTFNPELLITMAVPISNWSGQWYDFNNLKLHVDFFNAMTYDIHGGWSSHAGHNSPLYQSPQGDPDGSVQTGINYLISRGIPPEKLNMGIPFWGKQYNTSMINGNYTGTVVDMYYNTITPLIGNGWVYEWDNVAKCPYLVKDDLTKIITYDNPLSVEYKCNYAKVRNLGGVMVWALGYDDMNMSESLTGAINMHWLSVPENESDILPNDVNIAIYPNPFNPETKIKFNILQDGNVRIIIYNLRGERVGLIENNYYHSGTHLIKYHPETSHDNFSSGVYFLELITPTKRLTEKILYLK